MVAQLIITFTETEFRELFQEEFRRAFVEYFEKQHTDAQSSPELLSLKETAVRLNISLPTLHKYAKTGKIFVYQLGGKVTYKLHEVEQSLKKIQTR